MTKSLNSPIAVIYPLPANIASRILIDKKSVFVKYPTIEKISPKLASCKKLLIYVSKSEKELAGEATIQLITLMTLSEVVSVYSDDLFLTENELRKYSKGRDTKKMMVFVLTDISKYAEFRSLGHGITMTGEYIFEEDYDKLIQGINLN